MSAKRTSFVPLYTWVISEYGISLTDACIWSLIYSFSRDDQGCYFGSIRYIMDTCKVSESTAKRSLKLLESKGLIRKWQETVGNVAVNRYTALTPEADSAQNPGQNEPPVKMNPVQNDPKPQVKMTSTPVQIDPQIRKREKSYNKTPRAGARAEEPSSLTVAEVFDTFSHGAPAGLYDALMDFDQYRTELARKDKKKLWNAHVAKTLCKSIRRLIDKADVQDRAGYAIAMLNQSIENGWTGVFAVKDFADKAPAPVHTAPSAPDKPRKITKDMTLEELIMGGGIGA